MIAEAYGVRCVNSGWSSFPRSSAAQVMPLSPNKTETIGVSGRVFDQFRRRWQNSRGRVDADRPDRGEIAAIRWEHR